MPLFINDLLPEILGMILFEITERSDNHQPGLLASVCRSWNHVVQNTPELWSHFTTTDRARRSSAPSPSRLASLALPIDPGVYHLPFFEPFFRHIVDNPRTCKLSALHLGRHSGLSLSPVDRLVKEVLAKTPSITNLCASLGILEPTHSLLSRLRHLRGIDGSDTEALRLLRQTPLLQSFRLSSMRIVPVVQDQGQEGMAPSDEPDASCRLESMENIELSCFQAVPERLFRQLDLPRIHGLELRYQYGIIKDGDQQFKSLVANDLEGLVFTRFVTFAPAA